LPHYLVRANLESGESAMLALTIWSALISGVVHWPDPANHKIVHGPHGACSIELFRPKDSSSNGGYDDYLVCSSKSRPARPIRKYAGSTSPDRTSDVSISLDGAEFVLTSWVAMDTGQANTLTVRFVLANGRPTVNSFLCEAQDSVGGYEFEERFVVDIVKGYVALYNDDCEKPLEVYRKKIASGSTPIPKSVDGLLSKYSQKADESAYRCPGEKDTR
jgi:hypothetical protein